MEAHHPLPDATVWAIPFFIATILLEYWAVRTRRVRGRYDHADAATSLVMGLGNLAVNSVTALVAFGMLMAFWPHRVFTLEVSASSVAAAFVLYDFVYYWKHRFAHRVRWFWMEHVTHHSSQHYNLTTALRQPWFGPFTGLILLGGPMVMLGVHPYVMGFVGGLNLVYQYWVHTEAIDRLPSWFEAVFNTPSHHRVHHATNPRYLDANYAGTFIVWDKLFGTFVPEDAALDPPRYGIVKNLATHNPLAVAFHECISLLRDCASDGVRPDLWIRRALSPPGWRPDGDHARSEDIKAVWLADHPEQAGQPGLPKRLAR